MKAIATKSPRINHSSKKAPESGTRSIPSTVAPSPATIPSQDHRKAWAEVNAGEEKKIDCLVTSLTFSSESSVDWEPDGTPGDLLGYILGSKDQWEYEAVQSIADEIFLLAQLGDTRSHKYLDRITVRRLEAIWRKLSVVATLLKNAREYRTKVESDPRYAPEVFDALSESPESTEGGAR